MLIASGLHFTAPPLFVRSRIHCVHGVRQTGEKG